jgi:hypothetical protein
VRAKENQTHLPRVLQVHLVSQPLRLRLVGILLGLRYLSVEFRVNSLKGAESRHRFDVLVNSLSQNPGSISLATCGQLARLTSGTAACPGCPHGESNFAIPFEYSSHVSAIPRIPSSLSLN